MANDKRVDEIRERLEKATPGPWVYRDGEYNGDDNGFYPANDTEHVIGICAPNNRDFIAHSHSDIEYLLSKLASLRVQLEEAQKRNLQYEEDEASVCPEDVGFVEYIGVLNKAIDRHIAATKAAEAENVRLRDALSHQESLRKEMVGVATLNMAGDTYADVLELLLAIRAIGSFGKPSSGIRAKIDARRTALEGK